MYSHLDLVSVCLQTEQATLQEPTSKSARIQLHSPCSSQVSIAYVMPKSHLAHTSFLSPSEALMNISGRPVVQTLQNTAIKPENLIVVHDSLDHKPCTLSPKFGGSANGHNGVRSVIAALGGEAAFHRLRAGVGRDGDPADYVLGPLSPQERQFWGSNGSGADLVWRELTRVIEKSLKSR